jgi:general nucleoside transport system permease protein
MQATNVEQTSIVPKRVWRGLGGLPAPVRGLLEFLGAFGLSLVMFGLLLLLLGKDPLQAYAEIYRGALSTPYGWSEVLVKMTPFLLCALAAAIPAQVGLINVGTDGQLYMGAIAATAVALQAPDLPAPLLIPLLVLAGCLGGGLWGGLVGWMRSTAGLNETIASLLLNYVAILVADYLLHGPWKDSGSFNWPYTADFSQNARLAHPDLPLLGVSRVSLGIFMAVGAVLLYLLLLRYTRWGYEMRVVGGNAEAARRTGLPVRGYVIAAMLIGGAVAGLAGMIEVTAIQGRLQPGISNGYGYIGFLVAWLAAQRPGRLIVMGALLGMISVGGDVIQLGLSLPSSAVNILMALILFCVLGTRKAQSAGGS